MNINGILIEVFTLDGKDPWRPKLNGLALGCGPSFSEFDSRRSPHEKNTSDRF